MKKAVFCVLLIITTLLSSTLPAFANESAPVTAQTNDGSTVTVFADGSVLLVSPVYTIDDQSITTLATSTTLSRGKDVTYTDSNGNLEWKYTLTATFSYVSGVSSTCTKASYSQTINDSSWSFSDGSATKSGNTAYGKGTFKHKVLFITTKTYNIDISMTCDKYGNVT